MEGLLDPKLLTDASKQSDVMQAMTKQYGLFLI